MRRRMEDLTAEEKRERRIRREKLRNVQATPQGGASPSDKRNI